MVRAYFAWFVLAGAVCAAGAVSRVRPGAASFLRASLLPGRRTHDISFAGGTATLDRTAELDASAPPPANAATRSRVREAVGAFELPFLPDRSVWFAPPRSLDEHRLIAHLHGQCAPPSYSCGEWLDAGVSMGYLVCPSGNSRCGYPSGPAMWSETFARMDDDLENAIAIVSEHEGDGGISRDDAVMTGYSRGGWAAADIVRMHPGRWPHLIIVEADVSLSFEMLQAAGVKSVAMVAGDIGTEIAGEKKSVEALRARGYPAEFFIMKNSFHRYSSDIDEVMNRALTYVLGAEGGGS